jgi:hypothetical protein
MVIARSSKVPPPSREMQLPMLKHIAELLKRQKAISIETMGKKGRGILKELTDEHIKQFSWLTRNMMNHYTSTYLEQDNIPMAIDTQHQTVVAGISDSLRSPIPAVPETPTEPRSRLSGPLHGHVSGPYRPETGTWENDSCREKGGDAPDRTEKKSEGLGFLPASWPSHTDMR